MALALPAAPFDFALAPADTHVPEQNLAICCSGGEEVALPHCPALICGLQAVGWDPVSAPCGSSHLACVVRPPGTQQAAPQPLSLRQAAAARQPAALAALTMPLALSCWPSLLGVQLKACQLVAARLRLTLSYG